MTGRNSWEVGKMPIQFHKKAFESRAERLEPTWMMKSMSVLVRNQAVHLLWRSDRQCQILEKRGRVKRDPGGRNSNERHENAKSSRGSK